MTNNQPDDTGEINQAVQRAWQQGSPIDDALAQQIARRLTAGYGPLRDFAETGAISPELLAALTAMGESAPEPQGIWLIALDEYCRHRQSREPVAGWGEADCDKAT